MKFKSAMTPDLKFRIQKESRETRMTRGTRMPHMTGTDQLMQPSFFEAYQFYINNEELEE